MKRPGNYKTKLRRKRRSKMRRRRLLFFLLALMIVAAISFLIYTKFVVAPKTAMPQVVEYRDVVKGKGYLIFDEKVVFTKANGIAIYNVQEGKKVAKNVAVADINVMNDNSKVKDQLIRIQAAIDFKNDSSNEEEKEDKQREDETVIRNIQRFIRDEDYEKLVSSINTLDLSTKHTVNVSELNELLKLSISDLEEEKEKLTEKIASTSNDYKSPISGIVSYTFDDFKKDLSLELPDETFTADYLKKVNVTEIMRGKSKVKEKRAFFRCIGDTFYKIALPIDDVRLLSPYVGKFVPVRIGKVMTQAYVKEINEDDSGTVAILELKDHLQQVYVPRNQKVVVIKDTLPAVKVPKEAVVKGKKGQMGVYVNAVRHFVKFIPVDVLAVRGNYAILSLGDSKQTVAVSGGKRGKTIRPNDEIITEPKKVNRDKIVYQ